MLVFFTKFIDPWNVSQSQYHIFETKLPWFWHLVVPRLSMFWTRAFKPFKKIVSDKTYSGLRQCCTALSYLLSVKVSTSWNVNRTFNPWAALGIYNFIRFWVRIYWSSYNRTTKWSRKLYAISTRERLDHGFPNTFRRKN